MGQLVPHFCTTHKLCHDLLFTHTSTMPARLTTQGRKELDDLVQAYPKEGIPGTVVALVNSSGEELYLSASGPSDVTTNEPMRTDTVSLLRSWS